MNYYHKIEQMVMFSLDKILLSGLNAVAANEEVTPYYYKYLQDQGSTKNNDGEAVGRTV